MALSGGSKAFLVVLLLAAVGVGAGLTMLTGSVGGDDRPAEGETVVVEVPEGAGASQVAEDLEAAGVIRSATAFRLAARFDERSNRLRPGTYELVVGMDTDEIMTILSTAPEPAETFRVTIPEGYTVSQTLERVAAAAPHSVEALESALAAVALPEWVPVSDLPEGAQEFEGLLFPDTYEFVVNADPQEIISTLVEQTDIVLSQVTPPEGMTRYEVLVVASMIEREARVREEQSVISSVIHNRLARPMRLQIDATVQYARGEHTDRVLYSDLEIDSAWNTYQVDGLPPTPIAGAGRTAIQAAAAPAETDYLFYVVNNLETGEHAFATTAAEHEANVAAYRRLRAEAESGEGGGG